MKIKLDGQHILESDQYNIWISAEVVSKNGKIYHRNVTGYYRDIEELLNDYLDRSILRSSATSFTALKKEIQATRKRISEWKDVITLAGFNEKAETKKKSGREKA